MKQKTRSYRNSLAALAVAGMVGLGACSDDPVGIDDDHDQGVERIQLVLNDVVLAEYDGTSWNGELDVDAGTSTAHIDVRLIDHDGGIVTPDSDLYLEVDITNGDIAMWEQDIPGEFGGHLHGLAGGDTDAVFKLMHGSVGTGHPDYVTDPVHVHVNAPAS